MAALALPVALSHAPSARAAVYWGNGGAIGAANLDGRLRMHGYFRPDYPTFGPISAVAVSPDYLYWSGAFGIGRLPLYGPEIAETLVRAGPVVTGLAVDGSHLYWTTLNGTSIGRANLDGSDQLPQFIPDIEKPCGVAVDGSFVYWGDLFRVGRARLDGSGVEKNFISTDPACGVAVDRNYLYWGDAGGPAIMRAPLGGKGAEALTEGIGSVSALAVDGGHVYWTADTEGVAPQAAIGRVGLAGDSPEPNWLTTNVSNAVYGVAVDALPSPPPLPPKSKPAEIISVKHNRRKGFVFVEAQVPVGGKLRVLAPSFAWKILGKKQRGAEIPPGKWRIKLWPGRGTASESLRNSLLRHGRASARLKLSLKEFGKDPATTEKKVTFFRAQRFPRI
jgi:virginiamycin B lyase